MIEIGDDIDPEEMEAAQEACQPLMDDAIGNFEPPDPEELERMQEQMLEFAKCMREHGVDFPDPVFSGDGASVQISGGAAIGPDGDADGMTEAQEACQAELGGDGAVRDRGSARKPHERPARSAHRARRVGRFRRDGDRRDDGAPGRRLGPTTPPRRPTRRLLPPRPRSRGATS